MQVVIDIPDQIYKGIKKTMVICCGRNSGKTLLTTLLKAVSEGKPIKKNHGRLVDVTKISLRGVFFKSHKDYEEMINRLAFADTLVEADKGEEDAGSN